MIRILDITLKDLMQLTRDFKTFMFLLIMPIIFTFLFGYAFGGFGGGSSDSRLPVGYLNQDERWISQSLHDTLADSDVIRLEESPSASPADLDLLVADGKLAAAVIVPQGYSQNLLADKSARLTVIADTGSSAWTTIEAELLTAASRMDGAVRTATILNDLLGERAPFRYGFSQTLSAWEDAPIAVSETTSSAVKKADNGIAALAHTAPGMMLQFSIAGLLTAAQVIVVERKSRTLQRLLTTATRRIHILTGHFLAIFTLIFTQFVLLISFGQFILKVDYLRVPGATLLVAFSAALCISALGLLIGVLARSEEQAITFSLIPMFVFSGLGGAWVPLEVTGETFQAIGHLSPVAWAMDGFKNIIVRGFGFNSVLLPAGALALYALAFFILAAWRLYAAEERWERFSFCQQNPVAPLAFSGVHGAVGGFAQGGWCLLFWESSHTTTKGDDKLVPPIYMVHLGKGLTQFVDNLQCGFLIRVRKDNDKFITPIAANNIALTHAAREHVGERLQDTISHGMTISIIDYFEVVNVNHCQRQRLAVTGRARNLLLKTFADAGVVEQAGQTVAQHKGA